MAHDTESSGEKVYVFEQKIIVAVEADSEEQARALVEQDGPCEYIEGVNMFGLELIDVRDA